MAAVKLTDTDRLLMRNTLLAEPDLDFDAAHATAASHVLLPVVERIVAAHVETVLARLDNPALRDEVAAAIDRLGSWGTPHQHSDAALSVVKAALREARDDD